MKTKSFAVESPSVFNRGRRSYIGANLNFPLTSTCTNSARNCLFSYCSCRSLVSRDSFVKSGTPAIILNSNIPWRKKKKWTKGFHWLGVKKYVKIWMKAAGIWTFYTGCCISIFSSGVWLLLAATTWCCAAHNLVDVVACSVCRRCRFSVVQLYVSSLHLLLSCTGRPVRNSQLTLFWPAGRWTLFRQSRFTRHRPCRGSKPSTF